MAGTPPVARQLIAFGRLKRGERLLARRLAENVARQLIAFGRLKHEPRGKTSQHLASSRKTTNRLRAIETGVVRVAPIEKPTSRKTTNRLRAIETVTLPLKADFWPGGRKTTNRLRAIETSAQQGDLAGTGGVARQLIAFGRLKLFTPTRPAMREKSVARQLIAFGRLKRAAVRFPARTATWSQDN